MYNEHHLREMLNRANTTNSITDYKRGEGMQIDWKCFVDPRIELQFLSQIGSKSRTGDYLSKLLTELEEVSPQFFLK
jgi:hypothetical protein